jgi:tetratricopeptide (TPR) repeat protein
VEADDPLPGYPGLIIDHAAFPQGHILIWSPGQTPTAEQPGLAWSLEPGDDLILQLTLQPRSEAIPVQASVGLYFSDEAPALRPVGLGLNSKALEIPAGNADYVVQDRYRLPVAVDVLELFPYMHYLGKTIEITASLPDGTEVGLLQIEDWDFNWQDSYRYADPLHLPAGTSIEAKFTFDNSSANPNNPSNPPVVVRHGDTMMDEMAEVLLQVLPVLPGDTEALVENLALKAARNDIIGLQAQLRNNENNAVAHNDLGVRYLDIGQLQLARDHFGQAITIDPNYAEPHFNLSSLLLAENNTQGAIEELRRAVEIAPDYAEAHNNLGGLLASVGLVDDAVIYYRLAIQFNPRHSEALYNLGNVMLSRGLRVAAIQHYRDALSYAPNDAEVHSNLARALTDQNELDEAVVHYQRAIDINPELAPALIGLAWIRATAPSANLRRSAEALMLAEQTVRLVGAEHPEVLDTLAAAYAAQGRFDDAVATAQKAAAAARVTPGYESTAPAIDERIALYILFKPYRIP